MFIRAETTQDFCEFYCKFLASALHYMVKPQGINIWIKH